AGYREAARWFINMENIWKIYRTEKNEKISSEDYLNWQNKLTEQNLNAPYLVLYNSSAKDANATIVTRSDLDLEFVIDYKTYWIKIYLFLHYDSGFELPAFEFFFNSCNKWLYALLNTMLYALPSNRCDSLFCLSVSISVNISSSPISNDTVYLIRRVLSLVVL